MAGLDENGFTIERTPDIRESMNTQMRDAFGPGIDLSDGAIEGVVIGIVAERLGELWELAEAVHNSTDPDSATGATQDALCALTGTQRKAATASSLDALTLTGDDATVVPAGSTASVTSTGIEFATTADATLAALTAWAGSTAYTLGNRRTNGGNAYQCVSAGTSAASVGPVGTDPTNTTGETDGSVLWRFLGEGEAAVDVAAEATVTGPNNAVAGGIVNIETPVSGWLGVVNVTDADVGTDIETDEVLRIRREDELAAPGTSPLDAIRTELLAVDDVTSVTVFQNTTDATDADGVPPHAVEALVQGGADQDIWDQLLASVAAGIATHGTEVGSSDDSAGNTHTMKFSRPDELLIYVKLTLIVDSDEYPADGDDQIKRAIVTYGDAQKTGKNVVASSVAARAFGVSGVLDVTASLISQAPTTVPVASTTIAVSSRQLAVFDTARITIITSTGTP